MFVKKLFFLFCLAVMLGVIGCAGSSKKINDLTVGMTKAKVIEVMGEPNYTSGSKNVEVLNYKLKSDSLFSDNFFIRIKDGKVDRFGQQGSFGILY